jgi:Bacterial membrane protein YfhO
MKDSLKQLCILTALCVAVLAPYHRLIIGEELPIPSDVMISDLADGEFPARVEAGRLIRSGELPFWTPNIMSGSPLSVDPLSMLLFTLFPPALALGLLYGVLLVVTATGTYTLARHLGCSHAGAFLSGFAFAWSGFFVCQMRHLGIIGTVAFFPYALFCLDRALLSFKNNLPAPLNLKARTLLWLMLFALCFGMQAQAGFPQTVYICGLFYGVLILWRLLGILRNRPFKVLVATFTALVLSLGVATFLGTLMGMTSLLPIWELGTLSDRSGGLTFETINPYPYPPQYLISFFCPYYYGDISNVTFEFIKKALFWEVYGYAGMLTLLLALFAIGMALFSLTRQKKGPEIQQAMTSQTLFWCVVGILALGMVLSPIIPLYEIAFYTIPGFSSFRFPTRFLFVSVLSLCLLGGIGLTWLQAKLSDLLPPAAVTRNRLFISLLLILFTMADLVYHNQRQNPMIDSQSWLSATDSTKIIQQNPGRSYSPDGTWNHQKMFFFAKGWASDLAPYFIHRNLLQPNSNLLQGVPSLTAYSGISPRWAVDLIGDHNRFGLLIELRAAQKSKAYYQWLQALSVKWVITTYPAQKAEQLFLTDKGKTSLVSYLYELQMPLPRARFAKELQCLETIQDIKRESVAGRLDPTQTTLLHTQQELKKIQATLESWKQNKPDTSIAEDSVTFTRDRATEITLNASSREGAFLVLADTFYPGWKASINGKNTPIYRVNMMHRGVLVPPGQHTVTFRYDSKIIQWSMFLSVFGFLSILTLICYYAYKAKENPV